MAEELNSPEPALEAALALGSLCDDEEDFDEAGLPARACSGPNSRLALAAGGSDAVTPSRVEPEAPPPRAGAVVADTGCAPAIEELRASSATGARALLDTCATWR